MGNAKSRGRGAAGRGRGRGRGGRGRGAARARSPRSRRRAAMEQDDLSSSISRLREEREELGTLAKITHFDEKTVECLHEVFEEISAGHVDDSLIDREEFAAALGLRPDCLLMEQLFVRFDAARTERLTFHTFLKAMSSLSLDAPLAEKIGFSFELYDLNGDGRIDLSELKRLLVAALESDARDGGVRLSAEQIDDLCQRTLADTDTDGNGVIDLDEYTRIMESTPRLMLPFYVDVEGLLRQRGQDVGGGGGTGTAAAAAARAAASKKRTMVAMTSRAASATPSSRAPSSDGRNIKAVPVDDLDRLF